MGWPSSARVPELPGPRCEVTPPFVPNFEPELEWKWTGSTVLPEHRQVMMTPVVVDVNGDGVPDVVFNSYAGGNHTKDGVLRALSGADGRELWTVTDPAYRVRGEASLAAADLDHDGKVELCTLPEDGKGFICFGHDGAFKFRTSKPANRWGGVSFADLDGDGELEIIDGNHVFSSTGVLKWVGSDGMGGHDTIGPIAFAADLDGDGQQEVINDRAIYRADGTLRCVNKALGHGLASVGNFDDDEAGEVVVVWAGRVSLMNDDCSLKWTALIPGGGVGGAPNVADFDNDGQPEIGVAGSSAYVVFETDGSVKWSSPTRDVSSNVTGSSTFDFDGDGRSEVVYADEQHLRIYDGATGAVRFEVEHSSCTTYENPVVVDVDADDNAEIVVVENTTCGYGKQNGIRVYRDKKDGWVNTRRVWNQHAYSVTNVNDDGTVPVRPALNWLTPGLNTFRSNSQGHGTTSPFAASDLTLSEVRATCERASATLQLSARVKNQGDAAASAGLKVAFYAGDPGDGGTLMGVATLPEVLTAGASADASLVVEAPPGGTVEVYALVDDDGTRTGRETECIETNNLAHAALQLACAPNQPPVALCHDPVARANDRCIGSASVDDGSHDPDGQPLPLSLSQSPSGRLGLGRHSVVLTASDGEASDQCVATVTVVDVSPPTLSCPATQVLECHQGGAKATYCAEAQDNCGPAATTCTRPSGSSFPVGQTSVSCTATDGSGNTASCSFSVTVRDAQPPEPGCEKGLVLRPPNHAHVTVSLEDCAMAAQDACGGTLPLDRYGRILRVTSDEDEDANGNGDGATCQDIRSLTSSSVELRAERAGGSDGRVYTLHYVVTDEAGNTSAPATCTVRVPKGASGNGAVDSGVKYCVGEGCPRDSGGCSRCR
ncbi:FG-GAP-like repeat-containing protein [Myxococcaceae bacterium GXIMD 01537]